MAQRNRERGALTRRSSRKRATTSAAVTEPAATPYFTAIDGSRHQRFTLRMSFLPAGCPTRCPLGERPHVERPQIVTRSLSFGTSEYSQFHFGARRAKM